MQRESASTIIIYATEGMTEVFLASVECVPTPDGCGITNLVSVLFLCRSMYVAGFFAVSGEGCACFF